MTATSTHIAEKIRPFQDQRQRLDERVPKLEDRVRAAREAFIEASTAAATAVGVNGEERRVADAERKVAAAERELDAAQRERATVARAITALEREYAQARQTELTVDAVREARADFRELVEACATIGDVVRRDEDRRRAAEAAGFSSAQVFGAQPWPRDILDPLRQTLLYAAQGRDVDRGDVEFEGDPILVWRPKGGRA